MQHICVHVCGIVYCEHVRAIVCVTVCDWGVCVRVCLFASVCVCVLMCMLHSKLMLYKRHAVLYTNGLLFIQAFWIEFIKKGGIIV